MRTRLFLPVAIAAVTLALLLIGFHARAERRAAEVARQSAAAETAKMEAATQQTRAEAARLAADNQALAAKAAERKTAPVAKPGPKRTGPVSSAALHANNPALQNLWIAARRAYLNQNYGPFFRTLHLSPAQIERFKAAMTDAVAREEDISAAVLAKGLDYHDPAARQLYQASEEQRDAELETVLGAEGVQQFRDYNRRLNVRGVVDGLAAFVAFTDPLTPAQADALTQAVAEASATYRAGKNASQFDIDWAAADQAAQNILTPAQLALWQRGYARDVRGGWSRSDIELRTLYDKVQRQDEPATAKTP
jgi:hypothetical protein